MHCNFSGIFFIIILKLIKMPSHVDNKLFGVVRVDRYITHNYFRNIILYKLYYHDDLLL